MSSARSGDRVPLPAPVLSQHRDESTGIVVHTDRALRDTTGIIVAFSERTGGSSSAPYDSLNLAAHVGDDPATVDSNRRALFSTLGIGHLSTRVVTAEQVHGAHVQVVDARHAGAGSSAELSAHGSRPPVPGTDALLTATGNLPLMMFYADCVPVVLVAGGPRRAVAVVHAGWKGALASIPAIAAEQLADLAGSPVGDLTAYIGPHIARCCYEVDERLLSHFGNIFDTIGAVDGRLDLAAAVREGLTRIGVSPTRITAVGLCTRDHTDRYFSYRADRVTGRHGALAVITEGE